MQQECMHVCMIMQQEWRIHGLRFKSIMMESRVTAPHDYSSLATALRPKRSRWVKGNSKGPQLHGTLKSNNVKRDYSRQYSITFKRPPLSGVISHEPQPETILGMAL
ncbi:hypothetical protein MTR_0555s0020 [Medicago truncatula]|uniref:Uncharacterized protein n=1 Tax=Medicago truncatula TaxID=3880 RepID=A0A072TFL7_MEDTR|nr:hypothetical protein MTR_0555s0020 [Medicago truncatula]